MLEIKILNSDNALKLPLYFNNTDITNPFIIRANLKWAEPFGMLLTSKVIRDFRHSHPNLSFNFEFNDSTPGHSYACHMGFYKSISDELEIGKKPGEASGSNTYLPITEIDLLKLHQEEIQRGNYYELGETIEKEASKLSKILSKSNEELHKLLTYLIREILRNISEHSESNTAWICGQNWNDGSADADDKHYFRRKSDLNDRLYKMYDTIEEVESHLIEARAKKSAIESEKITGDNIYKVLIYFEKLYTVMNEFAK